MKGYVAFQSIHSLWGCFTQGIDERNEMSTHNICSPSSSNLEFLQAAKKDLPNLDADIAAGKFEPLRKWLNEKVHKKGSLYSSGDELMTAATGRPLDVSSFLTYLKDKYSKLYQI